MTEGETSAPIIVSGGSRGLGLAIVEHLLAGGRGVATFARSRTEDIARLEERYGERCGFETLDALDHPRVEAFVERTVERFGSVRGLVNNAALGLDHLLAHMSPEAIGRMVATNLQAPILLTRCVVRKLLLADAGGRIVTISSICGSRGFSGLSVYSATKGGLEAFTRSLARELSPRGILVNAIAPGFFVSQMSSALRPDQVDAIRQRTPTGRLTTEGDVLAALDLLLFANINMSGQTIHVDGGNSV